MKQLLIAGLLLLSNLIGFAQINMADSTAQAIGYWSKGEKQNYLITIEKTLIESGDTTSTIGSSSEVEVSILDSTENSYTIQWQFKNIKIAHDSLLEKQLLDIVPLVKVVFSTDELGVFNELINLQEILDFQIKVSGILKEHTRLNERIDIPFIDLALQDIQHFHSFHGGSYKLGEELEAKVEIPILQTGQSIDADLTFQLEEINEDDNFFVLSSLQKVNTQQLIDITLAHSAGLTAETRHDSLKINDFEGMTNEVATFTSIHGSGWVLYSEMIKTVNIGDVEVIEMHSIELL